MTLTAAIREFSTATAVATSAAADLAAELVRVQSIHDTILAGKKSRQAESLDSLMSNEVTSGVMETLILLLKSNPNSPDIQKCKAFLRRFGSVDEGMLSGLERAFREAWKARNKNRATRGTPIGDAEMESILNEYKGL